MRKQNLILLVVLVVLYLVTSLVLQGIYGRSFGFLEGEDGWRPDGTGGWVAHGSPTDPMPDQLSENLPLIAHYLPILIPGFVLALFMFTPLRHKLEPPIIKEEEPETEADTLNDESKSDEP